MENPTARTTTLGNGIRVVTKAMPHVRSLSVGIWVNVGARDEEDATNGLCHFIEHMVFKGTPTRSAMDIAAQVDSIGGHANAYTAMEHTCFHGKVLDIHAPRFVEILSDIFLHSVFDPREISRERDVVLQEILMMEDNPEDHLHVLSGQAFYGDHTLGRNVLGTQANLQRFDNPFIREHFQTWYRPERIVIAAAGSVNHEEFVDLLTPAFDDLSPGAPLPGREPPRTIPGVTVVHRKTEQVHLGLLARGLSNTDPDRFAFALLNVLLGGNMSSALFQEIREQRGLAYSVYSYTSGYADTGLLGVYAGVNPKDVNQTIDLILSQMDRFTKSPVDDDLLAGAKEYIKGSIYLSSESSDSQMLRLAQNQVNFGRYVPVTEVVDNLEAVTAGQIQDLAKRILDPAGFSLTLLGALKKPEKYTGLLN